MKNESKLLLRILRNASLPLLAEVKSLSALALDERRLKGEVLEKKIEELLRVKGPLFELESALDDVRFIIRKAAEGQEKLARIA